MMPKQKRLYSKAKPKCFGFPLPTKLHVFSKKSHISKDQCHMANVKAKTTFTHSTRYFSKPMTITTQIKLVSQTQHKQLGHTPVLFLNQPHQYADFKRLFVVNIYTIGALFQSMPKEINSVVEIIM